MTVTEKSSRKIISGSGWVNPLTHDFMVENASYVHVFADTVELVQGVDYTVTNVNNPAGYAVTIASPGSWAPTSWVLDARPPIAQGKDLTLGGQFGAKYEDGLDQLTRRVQRIWDLARRGLKTSLLTPVGDDNYTLPAPVADKFIGWNVDGTDLENKDFVGITALVDDDAALTANSATRVPSQRAVKSYAIPAASATAFGLSLLGYASNAALSSALTVLQNGANAITRTIASKVNETISVKDFGAAGDGTTVDTTAIQAAITAVNAAGGGVVYFPAGTYKTGALTVPANVCIRGAGQFVTTFTPTGNSQIFFSCVQVSTTRVNIELVDFGIDAGSATGIQGMKFVLCQNVYMHNVTFSGCPTTFEFDRGRNVSVVDCLNKGNLSQGAGGAKVWSSSDSDYIYDPKISRYYTMNIGNGVQTTMLYVRRAVQARLVDCMANDLTTGASAQMGVIVENDCQGCKVARFCAGKPSVGIEVQTGTGVAVAPSFLEIIDCDIDQPSTNCIQVKQGSYVNIRGGNFTSSGAVTNIVAIQFQGTATLCAVSGAVINGFNTTPGGAIGFSGNTNITVTGCIIVNVFFGFIFAASASAIRVFENSLSTIVGTPSNGSTGLSGNYIENNFGWNPITVTPPAVPATTVAYTNILGVACSVYVIGGTVTVIAINGTTTGLTSGHVGIVKPGETITLTYSVAPTWNWIGH